MGLYDREDMCLPVQVLGSLDGSMADLEETPDHAGQNLVCTRDQAWEDYMLRQGIEFTKRFQGLRQKVEELDQASPLASGSGKAASKAVHSATSVEDSHVLAKLLAEDAKERLEAERKRLPGAAAASGSVRGAVGITDINASEGDFDDEAARRRKLVKVEAPPPSTATVAAVPPAAEVKAEVKSESTAAPTHPGSLPALSTSSTATIGLTINPVSLPQSKAEVPAQAAEAVPPQVMSSTMNMNNINMNIFAVSASICVNEICLCLYCFVYAYSHFEE